MIDLTGFAKQLKYRRELRDGEYNDISLERLGEVLEEKLRRLKAIWGPYGVQLSERQSALIAEIRKRETFPQFGPHIIASLDSAVEADYRIIATEGGVPKRLIGSTRVSFENPNFALEYDNEHIDEPEKAGENPKSPIYIFNFAILDYEDKNNHQVTCPSPLGAAKFDYSPSRGLWIRTVEPGLTKLLVLSYKRP